MARLVPISFGEPGWQPETRWSREPTALLILQAAFTCYGMPRNVEEFQNADGRYIVTFDGSINGNLIQLVVLVTEDLEQI